VLNGKTTALPPSIARRGGCGDSVADGQLWFFKALVLTMQDKGKQAAEALATV